MSCKSFAAARVGQRAITQITDSKSSRTSKISMVDIEHLCDPRSRESRDSLGYMILQVYQVDIRSANLRGHPM
jgi:hypothetical protein